MKKGTANFWFIVGLVIFAFSLTLILCSVFTVNKQEIAGYIFTVLPVFLVGFIVTVLSHWKKLSSRVSYGGQLAISYTDFSLWLALAILCTGFMYFLPSEIISTGPIRDAINFNACYLIFAAITIAADSCIVGSNTSYSSYNDYSTSNPNVENNKHLGIRMHFGSLFLFLICVYFISHLYPIVGRLGFWGIIIIFIGILSVIAFIFSHHIYVNRPFDLSTKLPKKVDKVVVKSNLNSSN